MAYTPNEWATGDVITAEKLNNIEDGIVANEEAVGGIKPYVLEANVEINPETFTIVANTFELLDGSFDEAVSLFAQSVLVVHLIITGTAVEYGAILMRSSVHSLKIQGVTTTETFAWVTAFGLPGSGNLVGFAQITYNADSETVYPGILKIATES